MSVLAWIKHRPTMVMAIATTTAVWSVLSQPELSATNSVMMNRAIDMLMRVNSINVGAIFGYWTYFWFCELNEPKVSHPPGSPLWYEKRNLMMRYIVGTMLCYCLSLKL